MKKILLGFIIAGLLAGCGSVDKTTVTEYDETGKIVKTTETERDVSDFSAYIAAGDDNATTLSANVSKFTIGYGNVGLSWFSVDGVRVKAPVKPTGSNSADALENTAKIIKATKVSIQTEDIGVNTDAKDRAPEANPETEN